MPIDREVIYQSYICFASLRNNEYTYLFRLDGTPIAFHTKEHLPHLSSEVIRVRGLRDGDTDIRAIVDEAVSWHEALYEEVPMHATVFQWIRGMIGSFQEGFDFIRTLLETANSTCCEVITGEQYAELDRLLKVKEREEKEAEELIPEAIAAAKAKLAELKEVK